ncbi:MAG: hypothetical protein IPO21_17080 [Bacteroidales bacterium]|nr:hypothetical protein [Bacteroidales bacterium]
MDLNIENTIDGILNKVIDYGTVGVNLIKYKVIYQITDIVSSIIPSTISLAFTLVFFLFLNFGIAIWLGELLQSSYYGFLIIAVFYGLIGLIIRLFLSKWIKRLIGDYIVKQLLK